MNKEALAQLDGFTGTENYYSHSLIPSVVYTDGVKALAENADAYWLLDIIASNQAGCLKDPMLRQHQFWTLRKGPVNVHQHKHPTLGELIAEHRSQEEPAQAVLECARDSGNVAFNVNVPLTDFPFDAFPNQEARIWVAPTALGPNRQVMVMYLPSEH